MAGRSGKHNNRKSPRRAAKPRGEVARTVNAEKAVIANVAYVQISESSAKEQARAVQFFEPLVPDHFRDREGEVSNITDLLTEQKWCGLYGIGGTGKSSLAAKIASKFRVEHGKNVIWLSVGEIAEVQVVLEYLANAAGSSLRYVIGAKPREAHLRAITNNLNALIVFDDVASDDDLAMLLLGIGKNNLVLVTARREHIDSGIKFGLKPVMIEALPPSAAVEVLACLIEATGLTENELSLVASKVGNLPLALEIVAGELRSASAYGNVKTDGVSWATQDPSIDRLRASIGESVKQLGPRFAEAFCALGVFDGTCIESEALGKVCDFPSEEITGEFLRAMRQRMFARAIGDGIFKIHPIVIETARIEMHAKQDLELGALDRYIKYYHKILERNGGYEWNLKLFPNLIPYELEIVRAIDTAARVWSESVGEEASRHALLCLDMTSLISWYLHWRGYWQLRVRLCKRITDAAERGAIPRINEMGVEIGNLYVDRGWVHLHQGDLTSASLCAEGGHKWLSSSGDDIFASELSGQVAFKLHRYKDAEEIFLALRGSSRTYSRRWFVFSYRLSDILFAADMADNATTLLDELVVNINNVQLYGNEIFEDIVGRIYYRVAQLRMSTGDAKSGIEYLRKSINAFQASGIVDQEGAQARVAFASVLVEIGALEEGRAQIQLARNFAMSIGDLSLLKKTEEIECKLRQSG